MVDAEATENVTVMTAGTKQIVLYKFAQLASHQQHVQATALAAKTSCVVVWVDGAAPLVLSFPAAICATNMAIV